MGHVPLTETAPELVAIARRLYETEDLSFRKLSGRVGIHFTVLSGLAVAEGWKKFAVAVNEIAEQVETEIMAVFLEGRPQRPVNGKAEATPLKKRPGQPVNGKKEIKP